MNDQTPAPTLSTQLQQEHGRLHAAIAVVSCVQQASNEQVHVDYTLALDVAIAELRSIATRLDEIHHQLDTAAEDVKRVAAPGT